jgi:cell filamentation protein
MAQFLDATLKQIEQMPQETFHDIAKKYVEMNVAHPFME